MPLMSSLVFAAALATAPAKSEDPVKAIVDPLQAPPRVQDGPLQLPPAKSRFELSTQLPSIPGVMMDTLGNGWGIAQQVARSKYLQGRVLWVDCTANIDRYNTEQKIVDLVRRTRDSGFNTIVFDVKPISGQVVYKSKIAPRLKEWRGRQLPEDFEPLPIFIREAKAAGLSFFIALNALSEGHRDFKVGPGYARTSWQTVIYDPRLLLTSPSGRSFVINGTPNKASGDENQLSGYTDRSKMPAPAPGSFAIALNRSGFVEGVYENGGNGGPPPIPRDGSVLIGTAAGAFFLRDNFRVGMKATLETQTEYVPISQRPEQQIPLMMNPHNLEVQNYALSVIQELVKNYELDGIIYDDRLRYGGLNADFSQLTQQQFEQHVGRRLRWPDDVFRYTLTPSMNKGIEIGPYFDAWMNWRAMTLRNFTALIRRNIKLASPKTQFGVYAGSWYGEYQRFGNNWAANDVEAGFWYLTPEYTKTGMANLFDLFIAGCYYPTPTIAQALANGAPMGMTIESSGQLANRLINDQSWTYAGIMLSDFKGNPAGLQDALQAAVGATQGVMVFDLSHDIEPMWDVFRRAFAEPRRAPHQEPGLLDEVHRRRLAAQKAGAKNPPVPISGGAAGTGF